MLTNGTGGMVGGGFLLAACCAALAGDVPAKEWIHFKNGLKTPITMLVQAKQQAGPAQFRVLAGDVLKCPLDHEGPHTVQVIPDDLPNTGYHLGPHDLRKVSRALGGHPLELKGDFTRWLNLTSGKTWEDRTSVYFYTLDVEGEALILYRTTARRLDYGDGGNPKLPQARGLTAVVRLHVPPKAKVIFDGERTKQTGEVRDFITPPLRRGSRMFYQVTVEWKKGDHLCKETRQVKVRPGEVSRAYFTLPITPSEEE